MILHYQEKGLRDIPVQSLFSITTYYERLLLHTFVKELPNNSVIIEIGSALGGTSCLMADANIKNTIHCVEAFSENMVDIYNSNKEIFAELIGYWFNIHNIPIGKNNWIKIIDEYFLIDNTGKLVFEYITKNFNNITLHKAFSPADIQYWNTPIDVYFEDATHYNPELNSNIEFWKNFVKPGGYIVGHDYRTNTSDVIQEFNNLIYSGYNLITKVDSLIILQKPK
jgi:hypothetical protein